MICKNTSKWSFWCLPTMQKHSQILILSIQSVNVQTKLRSPLNLNLTKPISLCKPRLLRDAKGYYKHTHKVIFIWSKINLLRPFHQAPYGQETNKTQNTMCTVKFGQIFDLIVHHSVPYIPSEPCPSCPLCTTTLINDMVMPCSPCPSTMHFCLLSFLV